VKFKSFFPTLIYQAPLLEPRSLLLREIGRETSIIRKIDTEGIAWSEQNYTDGFTSYGSMDKLHQSSPTFAELEKAIDRHVSKFARKQNWDLGGGRLRMSTCWVNVMPLGAAHGLHLHPLSVVSGTFYVTTPRGSSPLKFEDPRMDKFMAQPPRKAQSKLQPFTTITPREGDLVLFESWLRHEVPRMAKSVKQDRVSVSFNYDWV
jgi:uncharacterized protein (TIGR02466 family)